MNQANFHQSLAVVNVFCNAFMIGTHFGWTSSAIVKLKSGEDGFTANNDQISLIVSINDISRLFGLIIPAVLLDRIGRKFMILISSFSMFISWVIMAFAHSIELIYCAKILAGITQGLIDATNYMYLAENCTPKMRGIMSGIFPILYCSAFVIEPILIAYNSLTFVAVVNALIGFSAFLTCIFVKETPYYLIMKGRTEEAKKNLMWLRGKNVVDSDIKFELDQIQQNMQLEVLKKRSMATQFSSPENYKSLLMILAFTIFITLMGSTCIMSYSTVILQPSSSFSVKEFSIMFGVFLFASACISPFVIERFKRRTLLLSLLALMSIFHILSFILYTMKSSISHDCFSWLIFTIITCSTCLWYWCIPIIIVIRSELLPMSIKAIGGSLCSMSYSIASVIMLSLFLPIKETVGIQYNFLLFFVGCTLQFILILKVVPETRGKTLVDIQMSLYSRK